jgi:hypothetical protein
MNARRVCGEEKYDPLPKPLLATPVLLVLLLALKPTDGRAEDRVCDLVKVEVSPALRSEWLEGAEELRSTLARDLKGPACIPVALRVEPSSSGAVVRARTADGRETVRPLANPQALVPVVFGLLASAPAEVPATPFPAESQNAASATHPPPSANVEEDPLDVPEFPVQRAVKSTSAPAVHVAIGLSTGVRAGVPTDVIMWDSELRVDVALHDWLIFALMRYAPLGAISGVAADTDAYEELGLGFGAGRRWSWGRQVLDITASPSAVFVNEEVDSPTEVSGEVAQLRIAGAARYGYEIGSGWRFTVTLDTEIAPSSVIKERRADRALAPVPMWTAGLRLGASAGVL